MTKVISIDPGISKCGIVVADVNEKKVYEALVINSNFLLIFIKRKYQEENSIKFLIGNGTSSQFHIEHLNQFLPDLIIAEEENSTYKAKERYFQIFPLKGLQCLLPREVFIWNKNLDALAALAILEEYFKFKFDVSEKIETKTWLK